MTTFTDVPEVLVTAPPRRSRRARAESFGSWAIRILLSAQFIGVLTATVLVARCRQENRR